MRVYEAELGRQHPEFGTVQYELARVVTEQGRLDEAETLLRECIETGLQAGEDWGSLAGADRAGMLAHVRSELGAVLTRLKRYAEAEVELLEAEAEFADANMAARRPPALRQKCIERLVMLYDAWNAADPNQGHGTSAEEWRNQLVAQ